MKANIAVFGSMAIAIDQLPAMSLNMQATIDDLKESFNEDLALEAGVSIQKEGKAYNEKVLDLFKYVQDNFVGIVFSSDVVMKHVGYQNNMIYG